MRKKGISPIVGIMIIAVFVVLMGLSFYIFLKERVLSLMEEQRPRIISFNILYSVYLKGNQSSSEPVFNTSLALANLYAKELNYTVTNYNPYPLEDFQVRFDLSKYSFKDYPTVEGQSLLPFCFEQSNGECNTSKSSILWTKLNISSLSISYGNPSIYFDGSFAIFLKNITSVNLNTPIYTRSICFWMNATNTTGTHIIFDGGGENNGIAIYIKDGYIYFYAYSLDSGFGEKVLKTSIRKNYWYFICATFDSYNNYMALYLNGKLVSKSDISGYIAQNNDLIGIGGSINGYAIYGEKGERTNMYNFQGYVSKFLIYNNALKSDEILELMEGKDPESFANLILYLDFNITLNSFKFHDKLGNFEGYFIFKKTPNTASDGDKIFLFYDDFNSDLSKWDILHKTENVSMYISSGKLVVNVTNNNVIELRTIRDFAFNPNFINGLVVEIKMLGYSYYLGSQAYYSGTYYYTSNTLEVTPYYSYSSIYLYDSEGDTYSSIGYTNYLDYKSALYTSGKVPPVTYNSTSTGGDVISNIPINSWFVDKIIFSGSKFCREASYNGTVECSTRYTSVTEGYLGLYFSTVNSTDFNGTVTEIDWIRVYPSIENVSCEVVQDFPLKLRIVNYNSYDVTGAIVRCIIPGSQPTLPYLVTEYNESYMAVPYCFEQSNGECSKIPPSTGYWTIYLRVSVPANGSITIEDANYDQSLSNYVFYFYDTFDTDPISKPFYKRYPTSAYYLWNFGYIRYGTTSDNTGETFYLYLYGSGAFTSENYISEFSYNIYSYYTSEGISVKNTVSDAGYLYATNHASYKSNGVIPPIRLLKSFSDNRYIETYYYNYFLNPSDSSIYIFSLGFNRSYLSYTSYHPDFSVNLTSSHVFSNTTPVIPKLAHITSWQGVINVYWIRTRVFLRDVECKVVSTSPLTLEIINYGNNTYENAQVRCSLGFTPTSTYLLYEKGYGQVFYCYEQSVDGDCNLNPSSVIWLRVPYIPSESSVNVTVLDVIHKNNAPVNATPTSINISIRNSQINNSEPGDYIFDFYDDFNDNQISTKWIGNLTNFTEDSGYLQFNYQTNVYYYLYVNQSFSYPFVYESRARQRAGLGYKWAGIMITEGDPYYNVRLVIDPENSAYPNGIYFAGVYISDDVYSDTWYLFRINKMDTNVYSGYISSFGEIGPKTSEDFQKIGVLSSDYADWDWVRVRKYADVPLEKSMTYEDTYCNVSFGIAIENTGDTPIYYSEVNVTVSYSNGTVIETGSLYDFTGYNGVVLPGEKVTVEVQRVYNDIVCENIVANYEYMIINTASSVLEISIKNDGDPIDVGGLLINLYDKNRYLVKQILGAQLCKDIDANYCYNQTIGKGSALLKIYTEIPEDARYVELDFMGRKYLTEIIKK